MGECIFLNRPSKKVLKSIRIAAMPTKLDYITGETFDPAGMVVMAKYSFGAEVDVTSLCTYPATVTAATHTISYTDDGVMVTAGVNLNYYTVSKTLANNSWDVIGMVAAAGKAQDYWDVGDAKTEKINGADYTFRIIDFDHDNLTSADARYNDSSYNGGKNKAAITFEMAEIYAVAYKMNSSNTNSGGWNSSYMRNSIMPTLKSITPTELRNVLRTVSKLAYSKGAIVASDDQLFLLSEIEVNGTTSLSSAGEGSRYAYYKAGNSRKKMKSGSYSNWWLRSPRYGGSNTFTIVLSSGTIDTDVANYERGVSFAFCV